MVTEVVMEVTKEVGEMEAARAMVAGGTAPQGASIGL